MRATFVFFLLLPSPVLALTLYRSANGTTAVRLTGYVKTLALGLDHSLSGLQDSAQDFTRARLMLEGEMGPRLSWTLHYEHLGVLNPTAEATTGLFAGSRSAGVGRFSLGPLDWTAKKSRSFLWRHKLDRLSLHLALPMADVVLGHQALSWGVGRLWTSLRPSHLWRLTGSLRPEWTPSASNGP